MLYIYFCYCGYIQKNEMDETFSIQRKIRIFRKFLIGKSQGVTI
jgi:hypothetical protein